MLKFIAHMQISRRLLFAFLLAAVIPGIIISILGFTFMNAQQTRSQAIQTNIHTCKSASTTATYLPEMLHLLKLVYYNQYDVPTKSQAVLEHAPDLLSQLAITNRHFDQAIIQYRQNYQIMTSSQMNIIHSLLQSDPDNSTLPKEQQNALNQVIHTLWPDYQQAQNQLLAALNAHVPADQATALLQQASGKHTLLVNGWNKVATNAEAVSTAIALVNAPQSNLIFLATLIAFLSTVLVVTCIGYVVYLTITRPLHQLALLTRRIAKGDTEARADISGRDEFYLVANSMNKMLDNIVNLIQQMQDQRDDLQAQIEKLVNEVSGIGEGDLRVQAEVSSNTLGVLANAFNYMVEELGSLVIRVKKVSNEVGRLTTSILMRMSQLVETGNIQLQQFALAEEEVQQVVELSRQVTERTHILHEVARVAQRNAHAGRKSVQQAVEGMERINDNIQTTASRFQMLEERSREVDEIIEVISNMALQTNRLALDAAIQAAMAGEDGKGFGAVAADIRRLAERSKDHTSTVARIIRNVREEINAVAHAMQDTEREAAIKTHLANEAGHSLETIFSAIEQQAHDIEYISQIARHQLQSANAVVQIMQSVTEYTRRSSTSTHDASRQMERLVLLTERLCSSVEAFKLRETNYYPVPNTNMPLDEESPLTTSSILNAITLRSQSLHLTMPNEQYTGQQANAPTEPIPEKRSTSHHRSVPSTSIPAHQPQMEKNTRSWQTLPITGNTGQTPAIKKSDGL